MDSLEAAAQALVYHARLDDRQGTPDDQYIEVQYGFVRRLAKFVAPDLAGEEE